MDVEELTRDQLSEAKGAMVVDSLNRGEDRYEEGDVLFPDDVITDEEAYAYYAGTNFVEDDFSYRGLPKLTEQQKELLDELSVIISRLRGNGINFAKSNESDDLYAVNADVTVGYSDDGTPVNLGDEDCAYHVCSIHACPKCDFEEVIIQ